MFERTTVTRREMLTSAALGLLSLPSLASLAWPSRRKTFDEPKRNPYRGSDDQLLDEVERAAFDFFWNEASSTTGQVRDRALLNGSDQRRVASIAATGFGLSGLCIGESRGYGKAAAIRDRVRQTLRFLARRLPNEHGFFYHYMNKDLAGLSAIWRALFGVRGCRFCCFIWLLVVHFSKSRRRWFYGG